MRWNKGAGNREIWKFEKKKKKKGNLMNWFVGFFFSIIYNTHTPHERLASSVMLGFFFTYVFYLFFVF